MAYECSSAAKGAQWKGSAYERASSSFRGVGCIPMSATQKAMESDERAAQRVGPEGRRQEKEWQAGLSMMGLGCMAEVRELELAPGQRVLQVPYHFLRLVR